MPNINSVDERISHQTADQADYAVSRQNPGRRKAIACHGGTFDVIHRLNQIVDSERDGGDQNHAEKLEPGKNMVCGRDRHRETKISDGLPDIFKLHSPVPQPEEIRAPSNSAANGDGD